MNLAKRLTAASLAVLLVACGDATGSSTRRMALKFGTSTQGAARARAADVGAALSVAPVDELVLAGTNGTLTIEDLQLIVSEVELKRAMDDACRDDADDECEEFEGGPFLVDLLLAGGDVTIMQGEIPQGTFNAVEFEVEDFEMEADDDGAERLRAGELFARLQALYPNVPMKANMVVKGVFTPTSGAARPFIVYFDADVEIKIGFELPLSVAEGSGITVRIDPSKWFMSGSQVRDLSALNGQLVEFEIEMKNGFVKVEHDD